MKASARHAALLLAMVLVISSCASNTDVVTESGAPPAASVPGEKVPGESSLTPGGAPGSANASVRW